MVLYPLLVPLLGFDDTTAGLFLGGSIHDVAQVVGAGYSVSPRAGDVATFTKLLRVATLLPVVMLISLAHRRNAADATGRPPLLPGFLLGFALLVALNSAGLLPGPVRAGIAQASNWCLITAIAALGMRTLPKALLEVGLRPVLLMVVETMFLAGLVIAALLLLR